MSEFPFGSAAEPAQEAEAEAEPASRTRKLVALGGLAAVALGAGAFFLLGGSDAPEQELGAAAPGPAATAPAPAASPAALPVASTVELGRNPFKALYVQPAVAPAAAPAVAAPTAPTSGGTVQQPAPTTGTAPPPPPPAPAPTTAKPPPADQLHEVQLASASGTGDDLRAVFTVDGKQYTVKIGDTFGPTKHLLLISLQQGPGDDDWTAVVQVGDGDPFDVVTGDPVFVP